MVPVDIFSRCARTGTEELRRKGKEFLRGLRARRQFRVRLNFFLSSGMKRRKESPGKIIGSYCLSILRCVTSEKSGVSDCGRRWSRSTEQLQVKLEYCLKMFWADRPARQIGWRARREL